MALADSQLGARLTVGQKRLILALSLLAFGLYVLTASPTAFWLDSSELAAGAFELGVPHPPGHPLFVLLAKLATFVPIGSIAFRVHLLCAALTAAAVGASATFALSLFGSRALTGAAALMPVLAVSVPVWFHAIRAEVYALHLLLAALILTAALRQSRTGSFAPAAALGLLTGLALSNHHYLTLFMAPGVIVLFLVGKPARRRLVRRLAVSGAFLVVGLLPYLLLPIRSAAYPTVRWGQAETPGGFLWVLSAKAFQKTVRRAQQIQPEAALDNIWHYFADNLGWIVLGLALTGLIVLARRRLGLAIGLFLVLGANVLTQVLFDFDATNPDVGGYFLLSVWLLATLAVGPLASLMSWTAGRGSLLQGLARGSALAIPLVAALLLFPDARERSDLSGFRATDEFADAAFGFVPTNGVMVSSYFETIFNWWYRDVAECRRPDVAIVHRLFRTYPGYDDYLGRRYPDLIPLIDVDSGLGALDADWLSSNAITRPTLVEMDPTLQPDLLPFLLPAGSLMWVSPQPIPTTPWPPDLESADRAFWDDLERRVDPTLRETAGNLLWTYASQLLLFGQQGQTAAAADRLQRAWRLAPGDPDLIRVAEGLGLEIPR